MHNKTFPWFRCFLVFSCLERGLSLYLDWRQCRHLQRRELPVVLKNVVKEDDFEKSVRYSLEKLRFSMIESSFSFLIQILMYVFLFYPYIWSLAGRYTPKKALIPEEYCHSLIFLGLQMPISRIVGIPFELYYDFVIEERHGFNKKTLWLFFADQFKTLALSVIIGAPITCLVIWVVKFGGRTFYFWLWGVSMALTFIFMWVYPNFIAPLFNKYESLKDTELKEKIEILASKVKYPLKTIYEVDASRRSAHSNAYFYGFWHSKRLVLFDTLLASTHDKILAVVGHELGHWKFGHTIKNLIFGFSNMFVMFYFFGRVFYDSSVYESFGFYGKRPVIIGLFLFGCIYEPVRAGKVSLNHSSRYYASIFIDLPQISFVVQIISTLLSRQFEFEADAFASELGMNEALQEGLLELHSKNLGAFSVDFWYAWFHYSHPQLVERLEALKELKQKQK